jgi:hypothetical protein
MTTLTAFDGGYNAIKALATNGRNSFFPSVIGEPVMGSGYGGIAPLSHTMSIEMDGGKTWLAGETALSESNYTSGRRDPGWVLSEPYRVLLCMALSDLHRSTTNTKMVTGLPIQDYERYAKQVQDTLSGRHTFRRNGGNWQTVTIDDVMVVTQPYGSLLDWVMADNGAVITSRVSTGTVGIVDIGGNTLNLLVTDAINEISKWTAGDGLGMLKALKAIAQDLRQVCPGFNPKAREVSQWLASGYYVYENADHDITPIAQPRLEPVIQAILNRMADVWDEPGRLGSVLLTGGGSMAIGRELKKRMSRIFPNVVIAENAHMANVRGYLKLARRMWG